MPSRPLFAACVLSLSACYAQPECDVQTAEAWPSSAAVAVAAGPAPAPVPTRRSRVAASPAPSAMQWMSPTLASVDEGLDVGALADARGSSAPEGVLRKRAPMAAAPAPEVRKAAVKPTSSRAARGSGTADLSVNTRLRQGLSNDQIRQVARASMGQVRACYERALKAAPSLRGRLVVAWTVAPSGVVSKARAKSDSLGDEALQRCVVDAVHGWSFPEADTSTSVSFPFVLKPG
ncbi:MAG: AgmX/PglI C-terminal domain-containing protein [Myxococcales bacterium]|nr:AgmX/PglI C-terminal domain-containing protein [Myxococcales bacterium]